MTGTRRVRIVVYEGDEFIIESDIGYYVGQQYSVELRTPDGLDWSMQHRVGVKSEGDVGLDPMLTALGCAEYALMTGAEDTRQEALSLIRSCLANSHILPCGHLAADLTSDSTTTFCAVCAVTPSRAANSQEGNE